MKFLVLALCVCAASAASVSTFGKYNPRYSPAKPVYTAQAVAQVAPVAPVATFAPVAAKAVAAPVPYVAKSTYETEAAAETLSASSDISENGYRYNYETSNGISSQAVGTVKRVEEGEVIAVEGVYRYISPDGTPVEVTYIADENGFRPQGNVLPVGPPIPDAIARSLAYIAAHPQPVEIVKKY